MADVRSLKLSLNLAPILIIIALLAVSSIQIWDFVFISGQWLHIKNIDIYQWFKIPFKWDPKSKCACYFRDEKIFDSLSKN